jgi:hypothetical protein
MKSTIKCYVCKSLVKKRDHARINNDLEEVRIAYAQMREHLKRVKHPLKHGWTMPD